MDVSPLGYFPDLLDQIGRVRTEVRVSGRFMCYPIKVMNWLIASRVGWVHISYLTY